MTAREPKNRVQAETIGVDLGGTKMLVGVCDGDGEIHYRNMTSSRHAGGEGVIAALEAELGLALEARPAAAAIGLGVPCTIDRGRGVCVNAVNLPLAEVALRERIEARFGLPVEMDNDGNVAAIAEHRVGAGRGTTNMVFFALGTGIAGGLILDGHPYRGSHGAGAELGHVVVDLHGPRCQGSCPGSGCIESIASGTALGTLAREAAAANPGSRLGRIAAEGGAVDGAVVAELARGGDELASGILATIGDRVGIALAGLANIFDPDMIVLGGGVLAAGELIAEPARRRVREAALPPQREVSVRLAELGGDAGMIGAALAARELLDDDVARAAEAPV